VLKELSNSLARLISKKDFGQVSNLVQHLQGVERTMARSAGKAYLILEALEKLIQVLKLHTVFAISRVLQTVGSSSLLQNWLLSTFDLNQLHR
jgi:hypothetical protein